MHNFVLTANYESRVSGKSHLRDCPNSGHLAKKVSNYKINLQNYVFLYFLGGWTKKVSAKVFQFLLLSKASLSNVQGGCGNFLNIGVEGKYQQKGEIL
jgi:hypothetical protein